MKNYDQKRPFLDEITTTENVTTPSTIIIKINNNNNNNNNNNYYYYYYNYQYSKWLKNDYTYFNGRKGDTAISKSIFCSAGEIF